MFDIEYTRAMSDTAEMNPSNYEILVEDTSLASLVISETAAVETKAAPDADKASEPVQEIPGPWFDNSPYDIKSSVREVGTMLRAFEDILWNHASDLNGIEAHALMRVVHRMRIALTDLEICTMEARFLRQQCMPSIALANGMKECFSRLRAMRNRLQALPGTAASAAIIDETGKAFAQIMEQQTAQQASAVGLEPPAAAAAAAAPKAKPAPAATKAHPTPAANLARRRRRDRKQNKNVKTTQK